MRKKHIWKLITMVFIVIALTGCDRTGDDRSKVSLDPDNPVSITVWHYYNGAQQAAFEALVEKFNKTVGREEGIYVESCGMGSIENMEGAISDILEEKVGAGKMPDIFSAYTDTAGMVQAQNRLVDLTEYFSDGELSEYIDSYISEGYFNNDGKLYLLPIAKSTEILMLNKTDWDVFAKATDTNLDELATVEGITRVAEKYYKWTDGLTPDVLDDGKAFYGRDAMANYFIIGMKQMGKDIFEVENGKVKINTDKELIKRLWENYYVPYIKGYFSDYGNFRSDDLKTGDILAYTGSTSSSFYFPNSVEADGGIKEIEFITMKAPVMEGGENVMAQQGAGMTVTKSDKQHEYAACVFLKWFTKKENNLSFACQSAYLPVLKEANNIKTIDKYIDENGLEINSKVYKCIETILSDFEETEFYTTKNFETGFAKRQVLENNLTSQAQADKKAIDNAVAGGADREEEIEKYVSEENFEKWYVRFCNELTK